MDLYKKKCKKCGKEFFSTKTQRLCGSGCYETPACKIKKNDGLEKKPKQIRKKKMPSIDEIAVKARELGMSYGKYMEMLTIEQQRKEREERMKNYE